jgi:hypothetical protein
MEPTRPRSPTKCGNCKTVGHTKRTCPEPIVPKVVRTPAPSPMTAPVMEQTRIAELEAMKEVFERPAAQRCLVALYSDSQSECKRNGACGMEIGMAREKDQVTVLQMCLGDQVNLCIDNDKVEDVLIGAEKVSIKHSSGKVGTAVKAKWTAADTSVQEDIKSMIEAADDYYPHLLITYLDTEKKIITILCVAKEQMKTTIKELGTEAFKVPSGNSRGIEYSPAAMKLFLQRRYFSVGIPEADVEGGEDPVERRKKRLTSMGLSPL